MCANGLMFGFPLDINDNFIEMGCRGLMITMAIIIIKIVAA